MKRIRPSYVSSDVPGYWLPPKLWKTRLYKLFGRTAPDRWVSFTD